MGSSCKCAMSSACKRPCEDAKGDHVEITNINHLPECVVAHILSCLSTKEAVATSILSWKWRCMWTGIHNLHLDDNNLLKINSPKENEEEKKKEREEKFTNFVERVLTHCWNSSITSFTLHCSKRYNLHLIRRWILDILRRNHLEKIDIDIWNALLELPICLFDQKNSLKMLRLAMPVSIKINPNNSMLFSSLKTLELRHVRFVIENKNPHCSYDDLVLTFPLLEAFTMCYCQWKRVKNVTVNAPFLTNFWNGCSSYDFQKNEDQLEEEFAFRINSSKLAKFEWFGEFIENFILPSPSSVVSATMKHFFTNDDLDTMGFQAARFLRQLLAVEHLQLSGEVLLALNYDGQVASLPMFEKLNRLEVYTSHYSLRGAGGVIRLLQRAPNLQTLTFTMMGYSWNDENCETIQPMPLCLSSHLKEVKFIYASEYIWNAHELGLMKYFLKNAMALEHMRVVAPKNASIKMVEVQKQLSTILKGSTNASIVFL